MPRKIVLELSKLISAQKQVGKKKISNSIKEIYIANKIDSINDLSKEEILLLASAFSKGGITDINQDAIHAIINSSAFPLKDILLLDNFGDSLLALKIELANKNFSHCLSFYDDLFIQKNNLSYILTMDNSIKLSKVDIDYIFAIAFTIFDRTNIKTILPILKKCIKEEKYDYLSYFSTEGIIAAEKLGLNIGPNESSVSYKLNVKDIYAG